MIENMKNYLMTDLVVPLYYWVIGGSIVLTSFLWFAWRNKRRYKVLKAKVDEQGVWASNLYDWLDSRR